MRKGAEIFTLPAGGQTLRLTFLISLNTTSAAISPKLSCKTVAHVRGKLYSKNSSRSGIRVKAILLPEKDWPSRRRHANEDAVAPEAVIDLVHRAGQFFRFTARRQIGVRRAREQLRLQIG